MDLNIFTMLDGLSITYLTTFKMWKNVKAWAAALTRYTTVNYVFLLWWTAEATYKRGRCRGRKVPVQTFNRWQGLLSSPWHFQWSHTRHSGQQRDCWQAAMLGIALVHVCRSAEEFLIISFMEPSGSGNQAVFSPRRFNCYKRGGKCEEEVKMKHPGWASGTYKHTV